MGILGEAQLNLSPSPFPGPSTFRQRCVPARIPGSFDTFAPDRAIRYVDFVLLQPVFGRKDPEHTIHALAPNIAHDEVLLIVSPPSAQS